MNTINPRALSEAVTHQLIDEIKSGRYSKTNRLPAEDLLAKEFGVSRSMMRECLTELERIGILSRHKGIGTYINRRVVNIPTRLDLITDLDTLLTGLGYETTSPYLKISTGLADKEVAENLEIAEKSPVFIIKRVIAANGKPVMFLTDYIPLAILNKTTFTDNEIDPSVFNFLLEHSGIKACMFLTEIRAVPLPEEAAHLMDMEAGAPVLLLCETGFDFKNTPVLYTREYLADQVIQQRIIRKMI